MDVRTASRATDPETNRVSCAGICIHARKRRQQTKLQDQPFHRMLLPLLSLGLGPKRLLLLPQLSDQRIRFGGVQLTNPALAEPAVRVNQQKCWGRRNFDIDQWRIGNSLAGDSLR